MSALGLRGHQVRNVRFSAVAVPANADAARVKTPNNQPTSFLTIQNEDVANAIRIYWLQSDFDVDANWITIQPLSYFEGPVETKDFYVRGVGGPADLVAVFYLNR